MVSNDSGLMHVAASLHRPLAAVFGSSDPHHTPPLDDRAIPITLGLFCKPAPGPYLPRKSHALLEGLTPERVEAAPGEALRLP